MAQRLVNVAWSQKVEGSHHRAEKDEEQSFGCVQVPLRALLEAKAYSIQRKFPILDNERPIHRWSRHLGKEKNEKKEKVLQGFEEGYCEETRGRHRVDNAGKWCREERVMGLRSCFRS